jgi:hypothetical protein
MKSCNSISVRVDGESVILEQMEVTEPAGFLNRIELTLEQIPQLIEWLNEAKSSKGKP